MRRAKLLPGLATSSKKLTNGTKRKYYYAWRGGPLLKADDGTPLQMGDPRLIVAYAKAHEDRKKPAPGTMFSLIAGYKASTEFTKLAERTRKDYMKYLRLVEDEFGAMPIPVIEDRRARGKFKTWRDTFADSPRKADYCWTLLARVLSVAKDRGMIAVNVCERGGRLYSSDRAEIIWEDAHIAAFSAVASKELQFALLLALWTGQRQGDLVKLMWTQYDGTHIRLKQGKRKKHVVIPVAGPLKLAMDARRPPKPEGTILLNTSGEMWTSDGLRTSWGKAFDKANLADFDLHFHDLRGTAVTRLAIAGCTTPQIASITGHSMKDVERILQANYLGGQVQLADQAIANYVAAYG